MQIGAQSYTVRQYCQTEKDLGESLEKIAAIGYRNIQLSAIGPIPPERGFASASASPTPMK